MYHHYRCICLFCNNQKSMDRFRFQCIRSHQRMIFRPKSACFFCLFCQCIDHACILAVYPGKASTFTQLFENFVHITVIYDHCRVGHIQLKAGNSLIDHILNFLLRFFIPLHDRHMKRIITGAFIICFAMPLFKTFLQCVSAFVLRRIINNQRRPSQDRRSGSCLKIISCYCPGYFQIKMCMPVYKSREKEFSAYIDLFCIFCCKIFTDLQDLFIFYQDIHFF